MAACVCVTAYCDLRYPVVAKALCDNTILNTYIIPIRVWIREECLMFLMICESGLRYIAMVSSGCVDFDFSVVEGRTT